MDAFVRQLAVLSVLWSLSELLLPEGRLQKMARMTVSVLVMAALVSGLGSLMDIQLESALPAAAHKQQHRHQQHRRQPGKHFGLHQALEVHGPLASYSFRSTRSTGTASSSAMVRATSSASKRGASPGVSHRSM